jgi:hypothetical protein
MPRGTKNDGSLAPLQFNTEFGGGGKCEIQTPCGCINLKILPDITDSKGATYVSDPAPGRSSPMLTYAYSDARTISTELHFMITKFEDIEENIKAIRTIQNLVLPGKASGIAPFTPPPVVRFICGVLMDGTEGLCLILKNYSIRYPTDVAWDATTFLPYRFSISCNWEVVYPCNKLPVNKCCKLIEGQDPEECNVFFPGDLLSKGTSPYYFKARQS